MQNNNNRKRKAETQLRPDSMVVDLRAANQSLDNEPISMSWRPVPMEDNSFLVREEFDLFAEYMAVRPAFGGVIDQA